VRIVRRGKAYWQDIVWGRAVPAIGFCFPMLAKWELTQGAFGAWRVSQSWESGTLLVTQGLGLSYFALVVGLYIFRLPKKIGDGRLWMSLVAFFGSFAVMGLSVVPGAQTRTALLGPAAILLLVGLGYALWSLAYLNRAFSILPQARKLVTGGPYGWSRHPLYLAEGVASIGLVLPGVGVWGTPVLIAFLVAQYLRIQAEEKVLVEAFGQEYVDYAKRVPRYLPGLRLGE
jgi:protein-S-isoprenylcysteine O-methyltransferase Ste14